jgi:hypothetical protein
MFSSHVLLGVPNFAFSCVALLFSVPYSGYPGFVSGLGSKIFWLLWFSLVAPSKRRVSTWLKPRPPASTLLSCPLFIVSLYSRNCRFQWPRLQRPLAGWYCGSNPARGMDAACECRVLSRRGLCVNDQLSRGVQPSVVYLSVMVNHR